MPSPNVLPTHTAAGLRMMVILWRWDRFREFEIRDDWLSQRPDLIQNPLDHKGTYFDVIPVIGKKKEPAACVVRANLFHGERTRDFLFQLLNAYEAQNPVVYLFLHRDNGYHTQLIPPIYQARPEIKKCLIFGGGKDFVYVRNKRQGILGDGDFFRGRIAVSENKRVSYRVIAQEEAEIPTAIEQRPFEQVWAFYSQNFSQQIYDFQEDLFLFWLERMNNQTGQTVAVLRASLKQNELLWLRMVSFLNYFQPLSEPTLLYEQSQQFVEACVEHLEQFEGNQQQDYRFDAFCAHLRVAEAEDWRQVAEEYRGLVKELSWLMREAPVQTKVTQAHLAKICQTFHQLYSSVYAAD